MSYNILVHDAVVNVHDIKTWGQKNNIQVTDLSDLCYPVDMNVLYERCHGQIIPFVPIGLSKKIKKIKNFGMNDFMFSYAKTQSLFHDIMLNKNGVFVPFNLLKQSPDWLQYMGDNIFLRPDSGNKQFPGQVCKNTKDDLITFGNLYHIRDDLMTFVCPSTKIHGEIRTFIYNGEIISHSHYEHADMKTEKITLNDEMKAMANVINHKIFHEVGTNEMIVADFVCNEKNTYLMEINNPYTSGFYNCNFADIIECIIKNYYELF